MKDGSVKLEAIRIHDVNPSGALAFDLIDLLALLAPQSMQAMWRISTIKSGLPDLEWFDATGEGGEKLEALADRHEVVTGRHLRALAKQRKQVIWGEFTGYLPGKEPEKEDGMPWLTIRAIDSSYFEIATADKAAIKTLRGAFKHIGPADPPFAPNPVEIKHRTKEA